MKTPRFVYGKRGVKTLSTSVANSGFIFERSRKARALVDSLAEWDAEVVISDFEPLMWAASRKLQVPFISFDSQHFALACKVGEKLSWWRKWRMAPIRFLSRAFAPSADLFVISKPFDLPTRKDHMHLVGPVLRPAVAKAKWQPQGTHVMAYVRDAIDESFADIRRLAEESGLELRVYGPSHPDLGDATYRPISEDGFIEDMATADFVISTAGSQLIGEAAYLGVPTLLIPEPHHAEQKINAQLAASCYPRMAWSKARSAYRLDYPTLHAQLSQAEHQPVRGGTEQAARLILEFLDRQKRAPRIQAA